MSTKPCVKYGIEVLADTSFYDELLCSKRIGLITAPTGITSDFKSTIDILHRKYGLAALFSPEHGVRGNADAGEEISSYTDPATDVPVYSLYRKSSKRLSDEMLDAIDVMIYDIQDVGSRYYTFLYTMLYALEDCAKRGIPFVVLDRPNPLGGDIIEGNTVKSEYRSFVGDYSLCMRYGLTAGEFAIMANDELKLGAKLTVVPCEGWHRNMLWSDTQLVWIAPSPALTSPEAALLYSGTCLFEGTNLSEGRGTCSAFCCIGAPYITDAQSLADSLNAHGHEGLAFRAMYFTPLASKHKGKLCAGIQLHVKDASVAKCAHAALDLLYLIRQAYPQDFAFGTYLPPATRPHIELISGSALVPKGACISEVLQEYCEDEAAFLLRKQKYHIYK